MIKMLKRFLGIGDRNGKADRFLHEVSKASEDLERWDVREMDALRGKAAPLGTRDLLDLYPTHPWIYASVYTIAVSAASVRWKLLKRENGVWKETMQEDPFWQVLSKPNRFTCWFDFFEATMSYLELAGNAFWEKVFDEKGNLTSLFLLRPEKVRIVPDAKNFIAGYIYEPRAGKEIRFEPNEVAHFKYFSPVDERWGLSPINAASNAVTLDFWATGFNKSFFKNDATPGGIIKVPGSLSEAAHRRLQGSWFARHAGAASAHRTAVLEEGADYKELGLSQKDMQFIETRKMSREEILAVFNVPPLLVGILEFANFANARQQKATFWQEGMIPKLKKLQDSITRQVLPEDRRFEFDFRAIEAMVEDIEIKTRTVRELTTGGIWTINEARAREFNQDPLPWGDDWWASVGLAPVSVPEGRAQRADQQLVRGKEDNDTDFNPPDLASEKDFEKFVSIYIFKQGVRATEKKLREQTRKYFESALARALEKLRRGRDALEKQGRPPAPPPREQAVSGVEQFELDVEEEKEAFEKLLLPALLALSLSQGRAELKRVAPRVKFDPEDPRLQRFVENWKNTRARGIVNDFVKGYVDVVRESVRRGEGFEAIRNKVSDYFRGDISVNRANRIARTETQAFSNESRLEAYKQSGAIKMKEWIVTSADPRDSHAEMNGVRVPIDEKFQVRNRRGGIDLMDGPGDPAGSPENSHNCRCLVEPVTEFD